VQWGKRLNRCWAEFEAQSLGHSNIASTVRYLGIEVSDAAEIAEETDV